ncbi:microfibril-associated glycoprotein 4-like [Gigantopelta aegis]|uniref:microfibril-associated glycoprotein 4-like n=1 Tax=Gigantopelta aegis TaxID=1735272 RepID=UPI001B88C45C|nr:microfibril-associated glycoprotein 4-like [Gigantopelta aegis]
MKSVSYVKNNFCKNKVLLAQYTYSITPTNSKLRCAFKCSQDENCLSFHFEKSSLSCHLNMQSSTENCVTMTTNTDAIHFDKVKPSIVCLHGGLDINGTCRCVNGFVGPTCGRLMTDCSEGYTYGYANDAVYNIQPPYTTTSFPVSCTMNYGGRTILQYRFDTQLNFYRNWTDYRDGFGSLDSDFWLGLENIYQIVRHRTFEIRFHMSLENGTYYQQRFFDFNITDETGGYAMYFSHNMPSSSNALGDSLSTLNGSKFSTWDVDNDNWSNGSCAQLYESGFWFNNCAGCNPNGRLLRPADGKRTNDESEVFWTYDLDDNAPYNIYIWLLAV